MFDIAASISVGFFGSELTYTQDSVPKEFNIQIERNLQIIDEETGAGQYINAAIYANSEFPFSKPLEGDTITAPDRTWKVIRKVMDDGHISTLEIR